MKRSYPLLLGLATLLVAADQWTKHWASERLAFAEPIRVVGDLVRLTYTRNSGIAFGLFQGHAFPFYVFSIIAALAVMALVMRHPLMSMPRQLSLAFILGGAIGNLIDRVATGEVVDFILLSWGAHSFPVFNLADTWVTIGVGLFAIAWTHDDRLAPALAGDATADSGAVDDANGGSDGDGAARGGAGGPLPREGADRPVA